MTPKIVAIFVILLLAGHFATGQKIVVDTASTSKYIIKKESNQDANAVQPSGSSAEDLSFGDRAVSIGKGILNRLKARLNLEEAAETIKSKGERFVGSGSKKNNSTPKSKDG